MRNKDVLKETGLTENESEIYLILIKLGEATIYEIANHSKISRPNIYDIIKKLCEKGLTTTIIKNNKKYFKPNSPNVLYSILKDKEKNLLSVLPDLNKIYESKKIKPIIEVFEGVGGLKTIMNDMVNTKKDIWIFNGPDIDYLNKQIPEFFIKRFLKEKERYKIKTKILYLEGIKPVKGKNYNLKKMPGENLGCASYWIYGNKVVLGIWSNPMLFIRLIGKDISKVYQKSIELVWGSIN